MLKTFAIAAALVGGIAAPAAFSGKTASVAQSAAQTKKAAPADSFAATCTTTETIDFRPEREWVGKSFANDGCVAPVVPATVDGFSASIQQIRAAMAAQKKYAADADRYQQCIYNAVAARRAQADKQKKTLDVAFVTIENHRIAANEADKLKVAAQAKETIRAYNEAGSEDCK
jgi:hypothetical protein